MSLRALDPKIVEASSNKTLQIFNIPELKFSCMFSWNFPPLTSTIFLWIYNFYVTLILCLSLLSLSRWSFSPQSRFFVRITEKLQTHLSLNLDGSCSIKRNRTCLTWTGSSWWNQNTADEWASLSTEWCFTLMLTHCDKCLLAAVNNRCSFTCKLTHLHEQEFGFSHRNVPLFLLPWKYFHPKDPKAKSKRSHEQINHK